MVEIACGEMRMRPDTSDSRGMGARRETEPGARKRGEGAPARVGAEPAAGADPRRTTSGPEDLVRQVHQAAGARLTNFSCLETLTGPPKGGPVSQARGGGGRGTRGKA